ncbi:SREBP regulating gene protein isoform X1 [Bacillus rossius redtenbacheri]|uniref:SREBP regulating gene protein isoform X1 n=1 Tax=Bacillus rossius redtenbacheri TaxID=93214 RepID=UPI002FDDDF27
MLIKFLMRLLRKRLVLGIILALSLTYCVVSFLNEAQDVSSNDQDVAPARRLPEQFLWHSSRDEQNETSVKVTTCRNSVQGKVLIVDDRGYVCSRTDVLSSGCCDTRSQTTKRYSCETCKDNGCCTIYEYCISCCLHPDKAVLQGVLGKASETFNVLFASVSDHFELCLAKCRTSSQSVQHENSYRDPRAKHCYGEALPAT